MDAQPLSRELEAAQRRLELLQRELARSDTDHGHTLSTAMAELATSFEELHVAQEELRQQNEQLEAVQERLDAEQRRYRELFELAPDAYVVTDAYGMIREVNELAGRLLRQAPGRIIGSPIMRFADEDARSDVRGELRLLRRGDHEREWQTPFVVEGERRELVLRARTVLDPQGQVESIRWILRDVSQRQHVEEAFAQLSSDLASTDEQAPEADDGAVARAVELFGELSRQVGGYDGAVMLLGYGDALREVGASSPRSREVAARVEEHSELLWQVLQAGSATGVLPDGEVPEHLALRTATGTATLHLYPLQVEPGQRGALVLHADHPIPDVPSGAGVEPLLAALAELGVRQQRALDESRTRAHQLQRALESRVVIEQAKGRLAERLGITPEEAFARLRGHARSSRTRVHELAGRVVAGDPDS